MEDAILLRQGAQLHSGSSLTISIWPTVSVCLCPNWGNAWQCMITKMPQIGDKMSNTGCNYCWSFDMHFAAFYLFTCSFMSQILLLRRSSLFSMAWLSDIWVQRNPRLQYTYMFSEAECFRTSQFLLEWLFKSGKTAWYLTNSASTLGPDLFLGWSSKQYQTYDIWDTWKHLWHDRWSSAAPPPRGLSNWSRLIVHVIYMRTAGVAVWGHQRQ
jgi:hypothetical protein